MARTLIVPVDGSPASSQAVRLVAACHAATQVTPVLLHVHPVPPGHWTELGIDMGAVESALAEEGTRVLECACADLTAVGMQPQTVICGGIPARAILEQARMRNADVIVIGTRGRGGLSAFGSVAARVAHGSSIPTILVRETSRVPVGWGERLRVLLAFDGSVSSQRAAAKVLAWRDWLGALSVVLLHAQTPMTALEAVMRPRRDLVDHWSGRAGEEVTRDAREALTAAGVDHVLRLVAGEPAQCVLKAAEQVEADLIVLGTRGLGAAHHVLLGSVALGVAQQARVPVILVP